MRRARAREHAATMGSFPNLPSGPPTAVFSNLRGNAVADGVGLPGVGARDASAAVGILDHGETVRDKLAAIERVEQDAVAAPGMAVDAAGIPMAATRSRHALGVECCGNGARALAGDLDLEDAAHDVRLGLVDGSLAADELAFPSNSRTTL